MKDGYLPSAAEIVEQELEARVGVAPRARRSAPERPRAAHASHGSPPPPPIRERVDGGGTPRIKRVKRIDRLAAVVITLGGIFIVVSVLGHLRLHPRPRPARSSARRRPAAAAAAAPLDRSGRSGRRGRARRSPASAAGHRRRTSTRCTSTSCWRTGGSPSSGSPTAPFAREFPLPASRGRGGDRRPRAASRATSWPLGTATGGWPCQQVRFRPRYEDQKLVDLDIEVRDRGLVELDPAQPAGARRSRTARRTAGKVVAALVARRRDRASSAGTERRGRPSDARDPARRRAAASASRASRLGRSGHAWSRAPTRATSTTGSSRREPRLTERLSRRPTRRSPRSTGSLGDDHVRGGHARRASCPAWFRVRLDDEDDRAGRWCRAHDFAAQGSADRRHRRLHAATRAS